MSGSPRAAGQLAGGTEAGVLARVPVARGLGAATAAIALAWIVPRLVDSSPVPSAVVGLVAAAVVLLAPRLGWMLCVGAVGALAAAQGHAGGAMVLVLVAGAGALLTGPATRAWSLPAGAGILGVLGLAGAWPGLAARSGLRFWQRGLVGGAGFLWVAGADTLAAPRIFPTRPPIPPSSVWTSAVPVTLHDVLSPLMAPGVLLAAAIWTVAAVIGPWLVTSRRPLLSLVAVTVWSAVTLATFERLGPGQLRGAVVGAVTGAVVLLAPSLPALARRARDQGRPVPRVP